MPFIQLNAVKQPLAAAINLAAAAFLVFSGKVEWTLVAVMAPGRLLGGGARRAAVDATSRRNRSAGSSITIGVVISIVYLVR